MAMPYYTCNNRVTYTVQLKLSVFIDTVDFCFILFSQLSNVHVYDQCVFIVYMQYAATIRVGDGPFVWP